MAAISKPVECHGKKFNSIKDFANYYGLYYSKVHQYLRKGKTPEEVLELCQLTSFSKVETEKKESAKRHFCEYNGVRYNSLYEAACALGLEPGQLYGYRSRNNLTPSAALEKMMEKKEERERKNIPKRQSALSKKCVVNGVEYESQEAAILAYHIPRITVYSRMQREGISFEEALIKGRRSSIYRKPVDVSFPSLHFSVVHKQIELPQILHDLKTSLLYYNYSVQVVQDFRTKIPALLVDGHTCIYLNSEAKGMETASQIPFSADWEKINALNRKYAATKLFVDMDAKALYLSMFQIVKEESQDIKTLLNMYFTYATIRETLVQALEVENGEKENIAS